MLIRSNPVSAGDGLRLGREAGAATSRYMDGFYGHLVVSPLTELREADFVRLSQWYCVQSVVVNTSGDRIADESRGYAVCAQAAVRQPEPRVAVLFDDHVRTTLANGPTGVQGLEVVDRLEEARAAGGRIATAGSWAELTEAIDAWGFDGARALDTLNRYNRAADADLSPPRAWYHRLMDRGPFYAVEAQPAITFTMGGLRIDPDTRVLRSDGTTIDGLHAAGADSGGTFAHGYGGGLALASVHGTIAAEHARRRAS
jgi:succinate dehydrogenase/fumarate reductase flavoprotein subunit